MDCICCGNCCKYVVIYMPLELFKTKDLQWYLCHGCTFVIDNEKNMVGIKVPNRCRCLDENNKCTIYDSPIRPEVCRKFEAGKDINCEAKKLKENSN